jgi:glutamate-5-semialdehyde dehydrogenase
VNVSLAAAAAKSASILCAGLSGEAKNLALGAISSELKRRSADIFAANGRDLERARSESLASPLEKRLNFDQRKLDEVLAGIESLIGLDDPVGRVLARRELAPGMLLSQVSCPIGVIGMVFESRPDALVQIAGLCLKSGNAVLLKGGREARETNAMLSTVINEAAVRAGVPSGWLHNMESREDVDAMLGLNGLIDLIIPRGSNEFVRSIMSRSSIPVMGHADGICHVYVHGDADTDMAVGVCVDSKTQYVAVCNAAETLLIHSQAAERVLPPLALALRGNGVEIRGCPRVRSRIECAEANEEDWRTEYLDYIVSIKIVDSIEEAVEHVNRYGSHHTDAIVSSSKEAAEHFMAMVDSASVFWNASTRFADGFKYGLGAEVGISTSKLHARGPVGMDGLLIYKWKLYGSGDKVADFAEGKRAFAHKELGTGA